MTLTDTIQKNQKYSSDSQRPKKIDNCILEMLATDMQPPTIVEDKGFNNLVHLLDSRYQLPSQRTLMRWLPNKYEEVKQLVKHQLTLASHVSLTTDIWTSRTAQSYMTITSHFIDDLWEMRSLVLETFHFSNDHTAVHIAAELKGVAEKWELSEKVVVLVTDNAANIVAATRIIAWKHVPCFAHTLNLIVKGALKADPAIVSIQKRCRDIVTFFHRSAKASDKLNEVHKQLKLPDHKLIQDVETRWNSTFYMFQRILEQHEAITTALCLLGRNTICLSCEDVESIKEPESILGPFEIGTTELSADKYVSISKLIPMGTIVTACYWST